jgi:hypothetical protein
VITGSFTQPRLCILKDATQNVYIKRHTHNRLSYIDEVEVGLSQDGIANHSVSPQTTAVSPRSWDGPRHTTQVNRDDVETDNAAQERSRNVLKWHVPWTVHEKRHCLPHVEQKMLRWRLQACKFYLERFTSSRTIQLFQAMQCERKRGSRTADLRTSILTGPSWIKEAFHAWNFKTISRAWTKILCKGGKRLDVRLTASQFSRQVLLCWGVKILGWNDLRS